MRVRQALLTSFLLVAPLAGVVHTSAPAAAAGTPSVTIGDVRIAEGDSGKIKVKVPVNLDVPSDLKTYIKYAVTGGTATARQDFIAPLSLIRTGTVAVPAGKLEGFVTVVLLPDTND